MEDDSMLIAAIGLPEATKLLIKSKMNPLGGGVPYAARHGGIGAAPRFALAVRLFGATSHARSSRTNRFSFHGQEYLLDRTL